VTFMVLGNGELGKGVEKVENIRKQVFFIDFRVLSKEEKLLLI